MFGMNRKDADGLLEDVAMLGINQKNAYRGPTAEDLRRDNDLRALRSENFAVATREVAATNALKKTQAQVADLAYEYGDMKAVSSSARLVIDALCGELARARGVSVEEVKREAYAAWSRGYDFRIGELLSIGELSKDPRDDKSVQSRPTRDWYNTP